MQQRPLGRTGLSVSVLGFGTFKLGRNRQHHFVDDYWLPSEVEATRLLNEALDAGVNLIDTAPSYGLSEERIGRAIGHRRDEFLLSTKVGEAFHESGSRFDYSASGVQASVELSLSRLRTDALDILLVHSNGDDLTIQRESDIIPTLQNLRARGLVRSIGFSGKTIAGHRLACEWCDVLMVTCHLDDRSQESVIVDANRGGVGVLVKKGLNSGRLDPESGLRFLLAQEGVSSVVVGSSNPDHLRQNTEIAKAWTGA